MICPVCLGRGSVETQCGCAYTPLTVNGQLNYCIQCGNSGVVRGECSRCQGTGEIDEGGTL